MNEVESATGNSVTPANTVALWWLGQSSFIMRAAGTTVYLDPYLQQDERRLVRPPLDPSAIADADLILCSHDHSDHIDQVSLPVLANASTRAQVLVPGVARDRVITLGVPADRVVVPPVDRPLSFGSLTVTAIPAAHEELDYDPRTGYPYLGFLLDLNGVTIYHSGDCVVYEGLAERLAAHRPDIALLPINGGDWQRRHGDIVGNMDYREAADLAAAVGVDTVIPMHYGMFAHNTEHPGYFVDFVHDNYPALQVHVMAINRPFLYSKP